MIAKAITRLHSFGLDIVQPFCVQDYNTMVQQKYHLPEYSQSKTLALLIGNSKYLWPIFIKHLVDINYAFDCDNPLDQYIMETIPLVFLDFGMEKDIRYTFEMKKNRLLPFQRIAEISGLCQNSKDSHLCYHPLYGSWFGLRAVVVLDLCYDDYTEFVQPKATNCICSKCDFQCKALLDDLMRNTDYVNEYGEEAIWRRWLHLRTICSHQMCGYSWAQAAYHYSKNQQYLKGEMERYRDQTFVQDTDWMEPFNHDMDSFRKGVFSFTC